MVSIPLGCNRNVNHKGLYLAAYIRVNGLVGIDAERRILLDCRLRYQNKAEKLHYYLQENRNVNKHVKLVLPHF